MLDRRTFGRNVTAGIGLAVGGLLSKNTLEAVEAGEPKEKPLPIVDTHQHLWDLKKFELPWLGSVPKVLDRSYLPADYAKATEGLNVVRAVYMEVDVAPRHDVPHYTNAHRCPVRRTGGEGIIFPHQQGLHAKVDNVERNEGHAADLLRQGIRQLVNVGECLLGRDPGRLIAKRQRAHRPWQRRANVRPVRHSSIQQPPRILWSHPGERQPRRRPRGDG